MATPHRVGAVLFDAYGTLFDLTSAVAQNRAALTPALPAGVTPEAILATWRAKQLEYTWTLSLAGIWRDFQAVTADALDFALAAHRADARTAPRAALLDAFRRLDPYPDAPGCLAALRARGLRTAILSNGTAGMLADAVSASGLEDGLDALFSVDAVQIYKPSPRVYALAASALDLPAEQIGFVSANAWDAAGAAAFGLRTVWLNRAGAPDEYGLGARVMVAGDLAAAATAFDPA